MFEKNDGTARFSKNQAFYNSQINKMQFRITLRVIKMNTWRWV